MMDFALVVVVDHHLTVLSLITCTSACTASCLFGNQSVPRAGHFCLTLCCCGCFSNVIPPCSFKPVGGIKALVLSHCCIPLPSLPVLQPVSASSREESAVS